MLGGHGSNLRRACFERSQVPFLDGSFARVDRLNDQFLKRFVGGGERRGGQETRELGYHCFHREIASPDAQISMIGHND